MGKVRGSDWWMIDYDSCVKVEAWEGRRKRSVKKCAGLD